MITSSAVRGCGVRVGMQVDYRCINVALGEIEDEDKAGSEADARLDLALA